MKKIISKLLLISLFALLLVPSDLLAQRRNEIAVPNLNGYVTLKCDLHMHTVFSDGLVWPTVRVDEAYREGLDAISLTEHIEYRPHKKDIVADHNRSHNLAVANAKSKNIILIKGSEITRSMAPGHFNAIFLSDSNPLDTKNYMDAFKEAKKQGAFIFWNHPGWESQQPDTTLWFKEHTNLYKGGYMHGIEVANGIHYYPEAIDWCLEKNLTMLANSDIHQPIQTDYDFASGAHRTMTFVFAKERSAEGIREALNSGRTAAWCLDKVIGKESILKEFFAGCVAIKELKRTKAAVTLEFVNTSDITMYLKKSSHNANLIYFRDKVLKPHTRYVISVKLTNGIVGGNMNFDVTNFLISGSSVLNYTVEL